MVLEVLGHYIGNKRLGVVLDFPKINYFMSLSDLSFSWNKCHFKLSFNDTGEWWGEVTSPAIPFCGLKTQIQL